MTEQVDSSYGFVFVDHRENHHFVDIYVPVEMLKQLQLVPGSTVLVKGLEAPQSRLVLRPGKGWDNHLLGQHRFLATLRFPNRPNTLRKFLSAAVEKAIRFSSIRMQGLRSETWADVMLEGGTDTPIEDFELGSGMLGEAAADAAGYVLSGRPMVLAGVRAGSVVSSAYILDLPLLPHQYGKIRLSSYGAPKGRPLKDFEGRLVLVRLALEMTRSTITVDLELTTKGKKPYLLYFESVGLGAGAPIAQTILRALSEDDLNIDAVDAFEYLDHDPKMMGSGTDKHVARVEMLLISSTLDAASVEQGIRNEIELQPWGQHPFEVNCVDIEHVLSHQKIEDVPEDTTCRAFRKELRNGRYAFIQRLGEGNFGIVNKYLDLRTSRFVAGKHIEHVEHFNLAEVRALSRAAEIRRSGHLVMILDCFYDGTLPVMIMEFVESTLGDSRHNPEFDGLGYRERHERPRSIDEVVEMAIQLLRGLASLHSGEPGMEDLVHADVKPDNIGLIITPQGLVWKLLDFGLARPISPQGEGHLTSKVAGTLPYMSPQVFLRKRLASNDIFSLGVVLFQVLNNWRYPGTIRNYAFDEIEEFVESRRRESTPRVMGFDESQWVLGEPFATLESEAEADLRRIVFKMTAFDEAERFQSAHDAITAFDNWKKLWLTPRSSI